MTDRAYAAAPDGEFRCPGEPYAISRSLHLARLSTFYRNCRECPHRFDHELLSPRTVRNLAALEQPAEPTATACIETLGGRYGADFQPQHARQLAAAFAIWLRERCPIEPIQIVLAFDGRPLLAEYVAQTVQGLRWAGCGALDMGVASAPVLAMEQAACGAEGALYLGSPAGEPHMVALKFWGPSGRPLSRLHGLEALEAIAAQLPPRPVRQHGPLQRKEPCEGYLHRLRHCYHALRPLRFVLVTANAPLRRSLDDLLSSVACQALEPWPAGTPRGTNPGEAVQREQAHFGIWIDGDGERLRLWDEQGREVAWHAVLAILARHLLAGRPRAAVAVETGGAAEAQVLTAFWLDSLHLRRIEAGATRAEMMAALAGELADLESFGSESVGQAAELGGGPSSRYWFCHRLPGGEGTAARCVYLPDAFEALTHLLVILSASDRPLSTVAAESLNFPGQSGTP